MLTLLGESTRYCDGVSRRSFLRAGALGLSGLSLADLLALRSRAKESESAARQHAAVIFVELGGGPSHLETYDPKPGAPIELRGPLDSVGTSVPGVYFSQYMREQARLLDKLAVVRSIHHWSNSHDPSSHLTQTGYLKRGQKGGLERDALFWRRGGAGPRGQRTRLAGLCCPAAHHAQRRGVVSRHGLQSLRDDQRSRQA
jgi:hypothetical protein